MSTLYLERIAYALDSNFKDGIDMSDYKGKPEKDLKSAFLSRALAAYCVMALSDCEPKAAGASITDGFHDNGLDAVYFDGDEKVLYLATSKWSHDATKSIDKATCLSFIAGIRNLIKGDLSQFNDKLKSREKEIFEVLRRADVRIVLILAYTSLSPLAAEVRAEIDKFLAAENDIGDTDIFSLEVCDLNRVYSFVSGARLQNAVKLQITLREWGTMGDPYRAYYGQVEVSEIAQWSRFGKDIFDRNLRFYRGRNDINEALEGTLTGAPSDFWYFNNGLTILCRTIKKLPLNGERRDFGVFECEGVSVVNGAQTVGVICDAAAKTGAAGAAKVHARLISLENCPDGFDTAVARATNTQNRIERRDFAALDPNQRRIAVEMQLDGKLYVYKSMEGMDPTGDQGCGIEEATVALACSIGDVGMTVQAKREVGKLWEDIQREPYTKLFNDELSAKHLWRAVKVLRIVAHELSQIDTSKLPRGNLVAVHGNRFVLHRVFMAPEVKRYRDLTFPEVELERAARTATRAVIAALAADIQEHHSGAYLANLFKNLQKCKGIDKRLSAGVEAPVAEERLFPD